MGITHFYFDERPAICWLWGTTDTIRARDMERHLCGIVATDPKFDAEADVIAEEWGCVAG